MLKFLMLLVSSLIFYSCTGTHEQNMERYDEVYGCDNPHKPLSTRKYKECIAKQRAGGESLFNLTEDFDKLLGNDGTNVIYQNSVNTYLWNASLEVTKKYPLKIADSQGGFIETDWIYNASVSDQRCLIKVSIKTQELVSNGAKVKLLCEQKELDVWYHDGITYTDEEKNLTLKILDIANQISVLDKLS